MTYSKMLKELFSGVSLNVEDLLLLESFQIQYLPGRLPRKEFAILIHMYPFIGQFFMAKNPSIADFIKTVLNEYEGITEEECIDESCDELIWEIADLIVYNKFPEIYDDKVKFNWSIDEIIAKESLAGKAVADVGAGSGMLAFLLAQFAETVYAIEPLSSFRNFIRQKAVNNNITNIYTIDGLLESIPLPDSSLDMLFTSNAIGWNIENELPEIERIVKPSGQAIHLMRVSEKITENPVHENLISEEEKYNFLKTPDKNGLKLKYYKTIKG